MYLYFVGSQFVMASSCADINVDGAVKFIYPEYERGYDYALVDGEVVKSVRVEDPEKVQALLAEIAKTEYQQKRMLEYPPITDYIDGVVKGDQAQIDAYIAACLAVKAKYPKPEQ